MMGLFRAALVDILEIASASASASAATFCYSAPVGYVVEAYAASTLPVKFGVEAVQDVGVLLAPV